MKKPVATKDAAEQLMDFVEGLWDSQGLTELQRLERVEALKSNGKGFTWRLAK